MSYEHGTTHFNLPQTTGNDTRDWLDTNEAFADIDAAIYAAGQTAESAMTDLTEVRTDVQGLKDADIAMTGRVDGIDSRLGTAELKIDRLQDEVIDDNQDLKDAICSIEEASATAEYPHNTGDFFWYNDTLYKAIANIARGQQIVPDTNCRTTNITTELLAGGGGGGAEIDDTVISAAKVWSSYKTNEEITTASAVKTGDTRFFSGKLQFYDGSAWQDIQIGGGDMPLLDFANPLHGFGSGNTFTATKECYLCGSLDITGTSGINVKVNNTSVANCYQSSLFIAPLKLKAGDVVTTTGTPQHLHVYDVVS